jgi:hypothetical protein
MSLVTIPYSFTPGEEAYSSQENANFTACANAINSIDYRNIQSPYLFASNIVPTTGAGATFGGSQNYTFPSSIIANSGYCPPVYTAAGGASAATVHSVQGQITAGASSTTITFAGLAIFAGTAYSVNIFDLTALAQATVTAIAAGSITFTSTSGHVYNYLFVGV